MNHLKSIPVRTISLMAVGIVCVTHAHGRPLDPAKLAGLHGGLVVQLGAKETQAAARLSLTGRYLVHVLDPHADAIESARGRLREDGHYGLAWAEQTSDANRLPYTENIVNLIVVYDYAIGVEELFRVLAPGGKVVVAETAILKKSQLEAGGFDSFVEASSYLIARKPRPEAMDAWSHPRHAADGNAVSRDTLVGPPARVRWIAAATSEVEGVVSAGGRNFYGGILARDSFNGLRLWHRDLRNKSGNNPKNFNLPRLPAERGRPIAARRLVFAVLQNRPVALNAVTGEVVVQFDGIVNPRTIIHDGYRLIIADDQSVRGLRVSGQEIWRVPAAGPHHVVGDGDTVVFIQGRVRRGEKAEAVALSAETGAVKWQRNDYPWLARTTGTVLASGQLVFEVSTLSNDDAGNAIHVVSAASGKHCWSKQYPPGMNHMRQARAMFVAKDLWILQGGKINTRDEENQMRQPVRASALDPITGKVRVTFPAGLTHCFPPVATTNFMFSGEMNLTNLKSGEVFANQSTKANCSRQHGWVPANGLVYTTPKHCTCWPMLRGFVATAPATTKDSPASRSPEEIEFRWEKGPGEPDPGAANPHAHDWPLYRHDRWRSASAVTPGPKRLDERWRIALNGGKAPKPKVVGPILYDWKENPIVKGPLSPPTIANETAFVTRPNAHQLMAIDTSTGKVRWRYTANGRLDTPPAIHRGLCLFGSAAGWVHALRADTGEVVWRLRAAPTSERIVAYGQVESPWPVPGAVLVMDDIAYFAAGRQPLADGGILIFAVDPLTGQRHWVRRIDTVPQQGFYENSGLEFDPFDILHAEGAGIAMSRWVLSLDGKDVAVDKWNAFAKLNTGAGEVWVPRGWWTYGPRHQHRFGGEAPRRPLIAFRDDNLYGSLNGRTDVFRRDFDLDQGETFDSHWITGWKAAEIARENGAPYRTYRIAKGAVWSNDPFADPDANGGEPAYGTQRHNRIHAMALACDKLYVIHQDGRLKVMSTSNGHVINETHVPAPAWDGLAIAENRLYLSTQDGELICLGQ